MIKSFCDGATEDVFDDSNTKRARGALPRQLWRVAQRKLAYMDAAAELDDLRIPPGNRLEALEDDRAGQHSIRINDQYRIYFEWTEGGPENVEMTDYH